MFGVLCCLVGVKKSVFEGFVVEVGVKKFVFGVQSCLIQSQEDCAWGVQNREREEDEVLQ